jgi:hypothetical protein
MIIANLFSKTAVKVCENRIRMLIELVNNIIVLNDTLLNYYYNILCNIG